MTGFDISGNSFNLRIQLGFFAQYRYGSVLLNWCYGFHKLERARCFLSLWCDIGGILLRRFDHPLVCRSWPSRYPNPPTIQFMICNWANLMTVPNHLMMIDLVNEIQPLLLSLSNLQWPFIRVADFAPTRLSWAMVANEIRYLWPAAKLEENTQKHSSKCITLKMLTAGFSLLALELLIQNWRIEGLWPHWFE